MNDVTIQRVGAPVEERAAPLYERHGFEEQGEIQAVSSPSTFPMLRTPR